VERIGLKLPLLSTEVDSEVLSTNPSPETKLVWKVSSLTLPWSTLGEEGAIEFNKASVFNKEKSGDKVGWSSVDCSEVCKLRGGDEVVDFFFLTFLLSRSSLSLFLSEYEFSMLVDIITGLGGKLWGTGDGDVEIDWDWLEPDKAGKFSLSKTRPPLPLFSSVGV
jgi:hypothetical protein